ncbi:MAG: flagellar type III secretion system protein FlhB [Roseobacter sp.]
MNPEEDDADKPFDPTPHKLLEARKKGEIARSTELLTAASYAGLLIAFLYVGYSALLKLGTSLSVIIGQSAQIAPLFFAGAGTTPAGGIIGSVFRAMSPVFIVPLLVVLAALLATRGIIFAPTKITPKLSKISIISNAKNKYGRSGLFQFLLSFLKLNIYSGCLAVFLVLRLDEMVAALHTNPETIVVLLAEICIDFLFIVVLVSAVIGSVDTIWQHFEHIRKNRMSRKEIQDETKNSEGDPHMKQERRQRAHSIASNQIAAEVQKADVILVNPTHFSVALRWDRLPGQAPICVAKGVDEVALRIREIARENDVPIHQDRLTARALYATTDVGSQIQPEHYKAVAAAIRFAEQMRKKAKDRPF